jgi:hypothetical protein
LKVWLKVAPASSVSGPEFQLSAWPLRGRGRMTLLEEAPDHAVAGVDLKRRRLERGVDDVDLMVLG